MVVHSTTTSDGTLTTAFNATAQLTASGISNHAWLYAGATGEATTRCGFDSASTADFKTIRTPALIDGVRTSVVASEPPSPAAFAIAGILGLRCRDMA